MILIDTSYRRKWYELSINQHTLLYEFFTENWFIIFFRILFSIHTCGETPFFISFNLKNKSSFVQLDTIIPINTCNFENKNFKMCPKQLSSTTQSQNFPQEQGLLDEMLSSIKQLSSLSYTFARYLIYLIRINRFQSIENEKQISNA